MLQDGLFGGDEFFRIKTLAPSLLSLAVFGLSRMRATNAQLLASVFGVFRVRKTCSFHISP